MAKRACGDGLNRHGHDYDEAYLLKFYDGVAVGRMQAMRQVPEAVKLEVASHLIAEAETGWDFTTIFHHRCSHFAPVHLNTLLWGMECNLAFFCRETGRPAAEAGIWEARAALRAALIRSRLWSPERGLFLNRDFIYGWHSRIAASDTFAPLAFGLATAEEAAAVRASLPLFVREFGMACTEDHPEAGKYQWTFPVAWPPMTWLAIAGLNRYGFCDDARRVAGKYVAAMSRFLGRDGKLWEKYDACTGEPANGEYHADPMLGWCAGVAVAAAEML